MVSTKNIVYFAILAVLLVTSSLILVFYYTQPFSRNFDFKTSINYGDIEIQKSTNYNGQEILSSAKAELGEVKLDNSGYFTKLYTLPRIVGCIDLNSDVEQNPMLTQQNQFYVSYVFYVLNLVLLG